MAGRDSESFGGERGVTPDVIRSQTPLSSYAPATPCPVLTQRRLVRCCRSVSAYAPCGVLRPGMLLRSYNVLIDACSHMDAMLCGVPACAVGGTDAGHGPTQL
eukprot:2114280-Rhodomonas_salina.1